ncbi:MAG: helix-turn-helix transcriptional regulator [Bacilli bacterium]|nr:helix-turn-helix transcriptional regulator [Bacilli bacterium]
MNDQLCPKMEATLEILGKKWIGLILFSLLQGPRKFTEIEKYIPGLSGRMLTERLKELETRKIVKKNVYAETPVRIEYELTPKGSELSSTFEAIAIWAEKWN